MRLVKGGGGGEETRAFHDLIHPLKRGGKAKEQIFLLGIVLMRRLVMISAEFLSPN